MRDNMGKIDIEKMNVEQMKAIILNKNNPQLIVKTVQGRAGFLNYIYKQSPDKLKKLLENGDVIQKLLEDKGKLMAKLFEPIQEILIEKQANFILINESYPIYWAIRNDHSHAAEKLIDMDPNANSGVYTNDKDDKGMTSLDWAIINGQEKVVGKLITKGADVNYENINGVTPLLKAIQKKQTSIAIMLIDNGSRINPESDRETTALMHAAMFGEKKVAEKLIEKGAHIDARDEDGMTALMRAAAFGQKDLVQLLIKAGADISAKDEDGLTAFMFAVQNN
jgi:ankyrin repeat protein